MPPGSQSSQNRSYAELAYQAIQQDIIRCELEPGRLIAELSLAKRYPYGRAAIRAALNRLAQAGLVQPLPRQGHRIALITLKHVRDLCGVRLLLEPPALRMAVGKVDIERLRSIDGHYRTHFHLESIEHLAKMMEVNTEFHLEVARATDNELLVEILGRLLSEMERVFHLGFRMNTHPRSLHEHNHKDMIDALEEENADLAEQLMIEQVLTTRQLVTEALIASPMLQSVSVSIS